MTHQFGQRQNRQVRAIRKEEDKRECVEEVEFSRSRKLRQYLAEQPFKARERDGSQFCIACRQRHNLQSLNHHGSHPALNRAEPDYARSFAGCLNAISAGVGKDF